VATALMAAVEADPSTAIQVSLEKKSITAAGKDYTFELPDGVRQQFLTGRWDSTAELLEAADQVRTRAATLGYFSDFA
jgi:3-isopropylmalate/(R)-2-methylmalate dehydratase small subunit